MPKVKKPAITKYAGGQYRPSPNGNGFDCSITVRGERFKSRQSDELNAKQWLDSHHTPDASPLTRLQMLDAQEAIKVLAQVASLTEAAHFFMLQHGKSKRTVSEAVACFLEHQKAHVKSISLSHYKTYLNRLKELNIENVSDVNTTHVEKLLAGHGAISKNAILRHLSAFFSFCEKSGWITSNPAKRIRRFKTPEPPKGVLSIADTEKLLKSAAENAPLLIPYLAIGLFAGLRPGELMRIKASSLMGDHIRLSGEDTKTANARTVKIRPNLAQWLTAYPPKTFIASIRSTSKMLKAIAELAKKAEVTIPKDGLRHSFATYAYEQEKNAAVIASEMGHAGTDVFFRHYRALARPGDGKLFFDIAPTPEKTVSKSFPITP